VHRLLDLLACLLSILAGHWGPPFVEHLRSSAHRPAEFKILISRLPTPCSSDCGGGLAGAVVILAA
jgi:hypothetical protein